MVPNSKRTIWLSVVLFAALLLVLGVVFLKYRSGIQVTIRNAGDRPLNSVVLHVTGREFPLGDINPGEAATAKVRSNGESGLEIEFTDDQGQTQRLNAGGYFEPGYRGTIRVSIKDGAIQSNEQQIDVY